MTDTMTRPTPAPGQPQRGPSARTVLIIVGVLVVALAVGTVIWTVAFRVARWGTLWGGHSTGQTHVVDGGRDGLSEATFDLVSGATTVTVRTADLGDRLYRVSTPDDSGLVPGVVRNGGLVQVHLHDNGGGGPGAVVVQLSQSVKWDVRLTAGATSDSLDLRSGSVKSVEFVGGVSSIDLALPHPSGTVTVREGGGVSSFALHAPSGVPVRVQTLGGAGSVTIDGTTRSGLGGGSVTTPGGWDGATDRYDVDNTAGVSTVTVDRS